MSEKQETKNVQKKFLFNLLGHNQLFALHSQNLYNLDLRNRQVSSNDIETLINIAINDPRRPLMSLQTIRLSFNNIQSYGVEILVSCMYKENFTLTSLDLGFNGIGDDGAKALSKILSNNNCSDNTTTNNNTNNTLKVLYLSGNTISAKGFKDLGKALEMNNTLEELHISANHGSLHGAEALASALRKNTKLKVLRASANNFTENGCRVLLSIFSENSTLEVLDISNNDVSDAGLFTFGMGVVSAVTSLTHLDLSFGNIGCTGMEYLVNSLQYCKKLLFLELKKNVISDAGATALAEYLEKAKLTGNLSLTTLGLGFNEIQADGINAIVKALTPNHTLQNITLSGNNINALVVRNLGEMLRIDDSLTHVHLEHLLNCAGQGGERYLAAAIASNSKCKLESITGFNLSRALLQVGSPPEMQGLTNEACLKILQDMWQGKGVDNDNDNNDNNNNNNNNNSDINGTISVQPLASVQTGDVPALTVDVGVPDVDNTFKYPHPSLNSMAVLASNPSGNSKIGWIGEDGLDNDNDDKTLTMRPLNEEERKEKLSVSMSHLNITDQKFRIFYDDVGTETKQEVKRGRHTLEFENNLFNSNYIANNNSGDKSEDSNGSGRSGLVTKAEKRPRSSGLLSLSASTDNVGQNISNNKILFNTIPNIYVNNGSNNNPSSTAGTAFIDGIAATMASHELSNGGRVLSMDGLHGTPVEVVQALAQIEKEPFSPSDLWRLDQYYFSPDPQLLHDQNDQNASSSSSSSSSAAVDIISTQKQTQMESQMQKVQNPLSDNEVGASNGDGIESGSPNEGTSPENSATTSNATDSTISAAGGAAEATPTSTYIGVGDNIHELQQQFQQHDGQHNTDIDTTTNMNTNTANANANTNINQSYNVRHHVGSPQAKRHRSEPVEYDGNNTRQDRLSRYPRLKFFLDHLKSTADETRVLCILRQLKYIEEYNNQTEERDNGTNINQNNQKMDERNIQSILLEIFHS